MGRIAGFFAAYPYLAVTLLFVAVFLAVLAYSADQRRAMLLSGVLAVPGAFASLLFVPEYWEPARVATFLQTGPEDLMFCLASGGLAWRLFGFERRRLNLRPRAGRLIRRFAACNTLAATLSLAAWISGFGLMTSALIGFFLLGAILLMRFPRLAPSALRAAPSLAIFWLAVLALSFRLWPEFPRQWNADSLWGPTILGVPLEEIVLAAEFAAIWPLLIVYVFDGEVDADGCAG